MDKLKVLNQSITILIKIAIETPSIRLDETRSRTHEGFESFVLIFGNPNFREIPGNSLFPGNREIFPDFQESRDLFWSGFPNPGI